MRESPSPKRGKHDERLHITMQFRVSRGMVYELRERDDRLTVSITEAADDVLGGPRSWTVEAFPTSTRDVAVFHTASTRAEALRCASAAWVSDRSDLPVFDWEAVARALALVRAI